MHDRLGGLCGDHFGDEAPVAMHRVLLEAQQTDAFIARQLPGLRQFGLGAVGPHMLAKDRLHALRMAGTHRIAPGLGRAQSLQVHIGNALLVQAAASCRLEKPGLRDCGTARTSISSVIPAAFNWARTSPIVQPS